MPASPAPSSDPFAARAERLVRAPGFAGRIAAAEVAGLAETLGGGVEQVMLGLLRTAQGYAHAPISNFHVGAVVLGASGDLHLGANLEFPGQGLGCSVHAEQAALANACRHAEQGVTALAVTAAPCGHCRQFLYELVPDGNLRILVERGRPATLAELLPFAFGPLDLGAKTGAFPVWRTALASSGAADVAATAAVAAASSAHAPYTQSLSGVALVMKSGRVYTGSYLENAAFNPSLPPLQAALVALRFAGEPFAGIERAVLAELEGATISQRGATAAALAALVPAARLETVFARRA